MAHSYVLRELATITCPDDLIATIAALTLAIRVNDASTSYCVYYNVFIHQFIPSATHYTGGVMTTKLNITSSALIEEAIHITGASLLPELQKIPGLGNPQAYQMVVLIGQLAYAEAYKWVHLVSIVFGAVNIIAA